MIDCSWEQAVSQLEGGIGVYSTFIAKNLNELSQDVHSFIREANTLNELSRDVRSFVREVNTLNELSQDIRAFAREAKERAKSQALLRSLEGELNQLDRAFIACENSAQEAVMAGRNLTEPEMRAIADKWKEVNPPYLRVSEKVKRVLQLGSGGIPELSEMLKKLSEAHTTLDNDIVIVTLKLTAEHIPHFRMALQTLTSRVSAELDRKIDEGA